MALIKGILLFPTLFTPKVAKGATEAKYSVAVLLSPNDPQIATLQAEVEAAKLNGCPSGYNGADECLNPYDTKYAGKDYYDPRFTGWYVFTCTAKADDKPAVVDMTHTPIIDPGLVYGGMVAYVSAGISYYPKGKTGIGGWLNGVMITDEKPPMGRLDGKPSVEQMFANVNSQQPPVPTPPAPPVPTPPAPPVPTPPAPPAAVLLMTAKANGATYESMIASGWTDELLLAHGMAIKPSFG